MKKTNLFMAFAVVGIGLLLISVFGSPKQTVNVEIDAIPISIDAKLRSIDDKLQIHDRDRDMDQIQTREFLGTGPGYYEVGDQLDWAILDDYLGGYYWAAFELRALGDVAEIWVQVDLSYPEGDLRDDPIVTDDQIAYLLGEFEINIFPIDTEYFGVPTRLTGTEATYHGDYVDPTARQVILVSNVRDTIYYDSSYPYYIAGFFSTTLEAAFGRNIITIDSHDWANRIGPDVKRPYLYESVIAHELQHLIHADYNPSDDSFMNEGCSMYSESLCGYPISWSDIDSFLATPDNSLTKWEDQGGINTLADYGQALLWTTYLSDHYGGSAFISHFVKSGIGGIAGIDAALAYFGYTETFDQVFHNWRIANLIHTDQLGDRAYDYFYMDLDSCAPTRVYEVDTLMTFPMLGSEFGNTMTNLGFDTGIAELGSYGTDYIKLSGFSSETFYFDGDDTASEPTSWILTDDGVWYSTAAQPESDLSIWVELDLTGMSSVSLTFDTSYVIEEGWDFGFVQVSTDGGLSWISLENDYTTDVRDPNAYPAIIEQLPGLTGDSGGWISMEFDLSAYAGETVLLAFRYMTDWATEEAGWWVDNVAINGVIIDESAFFFPPDPEIDFMVSIIGVIEGLDGPIYTSIIDLLLDDASEIGSLDLVYFTNCDYILIAISVNRGLADYSFDLA